MNQLAQTAKSMRRYQFSLRSLFAFVAGLAIILGVVLAVARHYTEQSRCRLAKDSFRTVLTTLAYYDSARRHLPPACCRDAGGSAISSWRFLITPYMDSGAGGYQFNAAWDDPANRGLAIVPCRPFCFVSMNGPQESQCLTNILAVTGPGTAFDSEHPRALSDLDPETILIVQTNSSRVHWMQPGDIDVSELPKDADTCGDIGVSGDCRDGFFVGFADGEAWLLSNRTPLGVLRKFFTLHRIDRRSREELLGPYRLPAE